MMPSVRNKRMDLNERDTKTDGQIDKRLMIRKIRTDI